MKQLLLIIFVLALSGCYRIERNNEASVWRVNVITGDVAWCKTVGVSDFPKVECYERRLRHWQRKEREGAPMPEGMPEGTVANENGTFTLPDGRVIRRKSNEHSSVQRQATSKEKL